jgi:predicted transcriptional regulator
LSKASQRIGQTEREELRPAIAVKKSVTPDFIVCLEDGKKFKSLKRHLRTHYNLSPEEYREKWGLPHDYPMVAPNYAAARSQLAKQMGLGTRREK